MTEREVEPRLALLLKHITMPLNDVTDILF